MTTKASEATTWDRVKEAIHRDWEQTKHDLHLPGGHELNQSVKDTLDQMTSKERIPGNDRPNPPKVIGTWDEAEVPIGFGYEARTRFGTQRSVWSPDIETKLRTEWEERRAASEREWGDVSSWVRYGYEYTPKA